MQTTDYVRYYHLEPYLFSTVHERFHRDHQLNAFDLMSIVVWKANRAKSKVAKRLTGHARPGEDLDAVSKRLTGFLHSCRDDESRLRVLMSQWGFRLPMASAILTVCFPERFTVYDVRVCEELGAHAELSYATRQDRIWQGYCRYVGAVRKASPAGLSLRDCDRYLWGRSAARQLEADIRRGFSGPE